MVICSQLTEVESPIMLGFQCGALKKKLWTVLLDKFNYYIVFPKIWKGIKIIKTYI